MVADYMRRFRESGIYQRMFFVSHQLRGAVPEANDLLVDVWTGKSLAEQVVKAGLVRWVADHVS